LDFASVYLRAFLGARSFDSPQIDSLAERMGVSGSLSPDLQDRYFVTGARDIAAATLGKKLVFGRAYFERLSDNERVAAAAHEFAHVLDEDGDRWRISIWSLGASFFLMLTAYGAFRSALLSECLFCASFFVMMRFLTSRQGESSKLRELRCDSIAVSFVGGEAMITALRLAESTLTPTTQRRALPWLSRSPNPTIAERAEAIIALGKS
jgi:Zn-dependent protease with chaperone function